MERTNWNALIVATKRKIYYLGRQWHWSEKSFYSVVNLCLFILQKIKLHTPVITNIIIERG